MDRENPSDRTFIEQHLFHRPVDLEDPNTLRNLSELAATKTLIETFKKGINALTVEDRGDAEIRDTIKPRQTRPFVAKDQAFLVPKKSIFNKIIGDGGFELTFAAFLDDCDDIISYAKNYLAVHFKRDYLIVCRDFIAELCKQPDQWFGALKAISRDKQSSSGTLYLTDKLYGSARTHRANCLQSPRGASPQTANSQ